MAIRQARVHGRKVWLARLQIDGRRISRVCHSREEARDVDAELRRQLREAQLVAEAERTRTVTLREAFAGYIESLEVRGKPQESVYRAAQVLRALEGVLPSALDRPITAFGEAEIFEFRRARLAAGCKTSTVNRDLRVVRALLHRVAPEFRFPSGAIAPEDETRVRFLHLDQERHLLTSMRPPFGDIVALAIRTLMRLSEIRLLRREFVHLDQGLILLPRAKAGSRAVVVNREAQAILRAQLRRHNSAWVFPGPGGIPYSRGHVSRRFRQAARRAGLVGLHFHDMRHVGATRAVNSGFSMPVLMSLGGWRTPRMVQRYAHVADDTLRAAAESISGNGHGPGARNGRPDSAGRNGRPAGVGFSSRRRARR